MLSVLELLTGSFLIWYSLVPFQNWEQAARLALAAAVLWILAGVLRKSKALFSMSLFFHFAVLFAFYLRAGIQEGWLHQLFFWLFLGQWTFLLYLKLQHPDDSAGASLFVTLSLISPLFCTILEDPRHGRLSGVALWMLPLLRACWCLKLPRVPLMMQGLLSWCLLSVPFTLYAWSNLQYLLILAACVLLYLACVRQAAQDPYPLQAAYIGLALSFALFFVPRELYLLQHAGVSILAQRHYLVEHPNTAAPLLTLMAGLLLHFASACKNRTTRTALYCAILFLAVLMLLTYSRAGWIGFAVLCGTYGWLQASGSRSKLFPAIVVLLVLLFALSVSPIRKTVSQRLKEEHSVTHRVNNWMIGIRAVVEAPFFGNGWFNYYAHAGLVRRNAEFEKLEENSKLVAVHSHSMPLDLAETAGIPLALLTIAIVASHLRTPSRGPALFAGILGVCANSLLDTGAFWLTVFPHLWVLLALLSPQKPQEAHSRPVKGLMILLFILGSLFPLVEDRFLLLGDFHYKNGQTERANESLKIAAAAAPLDVLPLERMKEICLSEKKPEEAIELLQRLAARKKGYAPYHVELGRLKKSYQELQMAVGLDAYTMLSESTYLELAALAHSSQRSIEVQEYLYKHLMHQRRSFDARTRSLVDGFPEEGFVRQGVLYARENAPTIEDCFAATDNFAWSLLNLRKPSAAARSLELLLAENRKMDRGWLEYFCGVLVYAYEQSNQKQKLPSLAELCAGPSADLIRIESAVDAGDKEKAHRLLQQARSKLSYEETARVTERIHTKFDEAEQVRLHYQVMRALPNRIRPDPEWSRKIAESYYHAKNYAEAAQAYHEAALQQYNSPELHWWEARCRFLAGQMKHAEAANRRLQRLIPSTWFTENLYRSRISQPIWPVRLERNFNENEFGGKDWAIVIFAHPISEISFPPDSRFTALRGKMMLGWGSRLEATDGVEFQIQNSESKMLISKTLTTQLAQDSFDWVSNSGPQAIVLKTLPLENTNYDWAMWALDGS